MRSIFPVILLVATMTACGLGAKRNDLTVTLQGQTYVFPKEQISARVIPPAQGSHLYVRLAPPASRFHLILDERLDLPMSYQPQAPLISRLTDNQFASFELKQTAHGTVACEVDGMPHFNCGFRLGDGPVTWSVLFDKNFIGQVDQMHEQALRVIATYKTAAL